MGKSIELDNMPDFVHNGKQYLNPVAFAMDRIGGTWKMPILWRLKDRVLRYGELKTSIPGITHKMLTAQLRDLEANGFVVRTVYPIVPPKTEYRITDRGLRAVAVVEVLHEYGRALMREEGIER